MLTPALETTLRQQLAFLYGDEQAGPVLERVEAMLVAFGAAHPALAKAPPPGERLTQDDVLLITYGDQVSEPGQPPLRTLADVLNSTFEGAVSGVHILPFYPYTSDDGFSVVDYTVVDPALGTWEDLEPLRRSYRMMYDAVINHISASSEWFQAFLRGEPGAEERFIAQDPATDLSLVTRPRTHPLLTRFDTPHGPRWIWTTFSTDQIDLNVENPDVLLFLLDVLLLYVHHGASLIRLDAIGYLWKEVGTRSIHLPQTHRAVQFFRSALDAVAPGTLLITETNVPHADNISYFGDGHNEAQLVYQFPLAPLTLNAFHRGSARHLTEWATGLEPPSSATTFFNFLASHDGIGVVPATGILGKDEFDELVQKAHDHGGRVSYKNNPDSSQSPYELNITLFDALSDPAANDEHAINRFIAANAIMLAMQGVPGIYIHSLIGSHNCYPCLEATGRARSINREKWQRAELNERMADPNSHERQVFARYVQLLGIRREEHGFHPNAPQQIIAGNDALFVIQRTPLHNEGILLCVHNVSAQGQRLELEGITTTMHDLIGGSVIAPTTDGSLAVDVAPYQVLWLKSA